ncbi:MAG TPA: HK97-gp10 family putative phage morphogenesis protein [Vicinamibacterales bacterium]|nr:HK97-gp10 family putative phage morphogenesis protein [Vicinamibacterales bacterium]
MPISGSVKGKAAIKATLAAMPDTVRAELGEAIRVTASEVVRNAKMSVPVRTGTLRNHIKFSFSPTYARARVGIEAGTVVIDGRPLRASYYAHMVEYGTVKMSAHPFMRPAFEGQKTPLDSRMRAAQRATIDTVTNIGSRYL